MLKLRKGQFLGTTEFYHAAGGATISVTHYDLDDRQSNLMHYHEHPNIYYILNGGSIEKRNRTEQELNVGNLRFYQSGEYHQNVRQGNVAKSINLEINSEWLYYNNSSENMLENAVRTSWAGFLVLKIYHELLAADHGSIPAVELLLADLVNTTDKTSLSSWPVWIKQVNSLLHDRWNEFLSLDELALESGVNPITISKHFHRYFNCTLGEYMRKLKVERSVMLIRSTNLSLTDIAYQCGFADQSHFIRCFKQYTSFLPAHFRKA